MRIAWLVLVIACSGPHRQPAPQQQQQQRPPPTPAQLGEIFGRPGCPGAAFPDTTGWCQVPVRQRTATMWLAVSSDLATIKKLGTDPQDSGRTAVLDRASGVHVSSTNLIPRIQKKQLQLRTRPTSCHESGAGCMGRCWRDEGSTVFEDPAPATGCIAASLELPGGMIISVGGQLRAYASTEQGVATRGSLVPSALQAIRRLDDSVLLQDKTGVLWLATWKREDNAPTLRALTRQSEILAVSHTSERSFLAITTDALVEFDEETLAPRWRFAGEIWSQTYDWELKRHYVLAIERTPVPRAIVHMIDRTGTVTNSKVVYEGADLVEARVLLSTNGVLVEITR